MSAISAISNTTNGTAMLSSSDCSYYSCDHSADYVGNGSDGVTGLTKDGVIYPDYKPFGAVAEPVHGPSMLSSTDCNYYSCDHSHDYVGTTSDGVNNLTKDGMIYPGYSPAVAEHSTVLSSTDCNYYSCDHSHDYVGTTSDGVNNLTKDGTIYPGYSPAVAENAHAPTMLSEPTGCSGYACNNSADYIGSDGKLLTDGVIYPAQTKAPLPMLDSTDCSYYSCDHSADYIGSNSDGVSNLTAPGTIYPGFKYGVWGAVATHPQGPAPSMLADGSHSLPPDHSGAIYCTEPEANCSVTVVDPVLKPIVYPPVQQLAAPAAAPVALENGAAPAAKPSRPSPGHLMLMGHACILGALDATSKMAAGLFSDTEGEGASWRENFVASSTAAASAVTPVGGFILKERILKAWPPPRARCPLPWTTPLPCACVLGWHCAMPSGQAAWSALPSSPGNPTPPTTTVTTAARPIGTAGDRVASEGAADRKAV
eukprot:CAMPEP_0172171412 /NCGR_PEP_ID=MMETSP1050-20130122/11879_1 /TAXON_ID=233186 /ORGANISM="Cryptomonas curvata, Strain CCAP979/52" /LENGTH=480 /DNA_ID=CAMNT_0012842843 /DNA_START=68 /DNA_END=1512 /DNA_ORIENTATION=-